MRILLDEVLKDKKISVRQAERMTDVSKSSISKIRRGKVYPTALTLEKLAKGLNVRIIDLMESKYL